MVAAGTAGRYNQGVPRENTKVATGGSTSMKNVIAALTEGFAEVEPGVPAIRKIGLFRFLFGTE